ncbi:MAG: VOC family protein [Eubacteriales bacterium]|nr:VOC family protein [Eubacteriales bacterium]MDD4541771.1 VOC family protein [Eubacteriales bacterium]
MVKAGHVEIYLYFNGNGGEALDFYLSTLGGEVTSMMLYKDLPAAEMEGSGAGFDQDAILHATYKLGDVNIMLSDNDRGDLTMGENIALNWSHDDEAEVRRVWEAFVAAGSRVTMPLEFAFFTPLYGALVDPFGIPWQIMLWAE